MSAGRGLRLNALFAGGWLVVFAIVSVARAAESGAVPLPDFEPASIRDVERARTALAAAEVARREFAARWLEREARCYEAVLVTPCVEAVDAERRQGDLRIRNIETAARAVLRADDARQRAADAAQRAAQREADTPAAAQRREDDLADRQAREARAAERDASRTSGASQREERAREGEARQRAKLLELEARRSKLETRRQDEERNAAAHAERMREHEASERRRLERKRERALSTPSEAPAPMPGR